jgi:hypothetical protein
LIDDVERTEGEAPEHHPLRYLTDLYDQAQRLRIGVDNRIRAAAQGADQGEPDPELAEVAADMAAVERKIFRRMGREVKHHPAWPWLDGEVIDRALELERAEGKAPEVATVGDALAVLERHGEAPPEGFDPDTLLEVPVAEKIEHKSARIIIPTPAAAEKAPPDVKAEDALARWATSLYEQAMLIAAGGVLLKTDSLDTAASVLWWANFAVQAGYFPDGHPGEDLDLQDEEALRLWVEREHERGNIAHAVVSEGLRLASTGRLMDEAEE